MYAEVQPSGGSLRIVWSSFVLKLASPDLQYRLKWSWLVIGNGKDTYLAVPGLEPRLCSLNKPLLTLMYCVCTYWRMDKISSCRDLPFLYVFMSHEPRFSAVCNNSLFIRMQLGTTPLWLQLMPCVTGILNFLGVDSSAVFGCERGDLASVSLCRKVKCFRRQVCVQLDANSPVPCQVVIVRAGGRRVDRWPPIIRKRRQSVVRIAQ